MTIVKKIKVMFYLRALAKVLFINMLMVSSSYAAEADLSEQEAIDAQIAHESRVFPIYQKLLISMYEKHNHRLDSLIEELKNQQMVMANAWQGLDENQYYVDKHLLQSLQGSWSDLLNDWANVIALPVDGLRTDNRNLKIESFPLRAGFLENKVDKLLVSSNLVEQLNSVEKLQQKSVVMQGLPAMEYLLFDYLVEANKSNDKEDNKNAAWLLWLINKNVTSLIQAVKDDNELLMANFSEYNFSDTLIELDDVINRLDTNLVEIVKKRFIIGQIKMTKSISEQSDFSWHRSGQSFHYIVQRVNESLTYLAGNNETLGYDVADLLLDIRYRGVSRLLESKVSELDSTLTMLDTKLTAQHEKITEDTLLLLEQAYENIVDIELYLTSAIYASIDISRDFNSTDGD